MLKSISSAVAGAAIAVVFATPAFATGQVYGDYGYNNGYYQPVSRYSDCDGDVAVGTGLGAVVGGIIGNQFGRGSGRAAATVGGVVLGGIIGNKIAKDSCRDDRHDAYYYNGTYYDAFNDPDDDREWEWRNPYNDHYGYIRAGEYYEDGWEDYDGPCREFTQRVYVDGRWQRAWGVACRQRDGSWRIVSGR